VLLTVDLDRLYVLRQGRNAPLEALTGVGGRFGSTGAPVATTGRWSAPCLWTKQICKDNLE
jgi:hypothetical protein